MSGAPGAASGADPERDNTRVYAGVIAVEVLVLAAIWLIQRHFG